MYWNKISRVNKLYPLSQWMISLMKANHHFVTLSLVFSSYYYYYCDRYWWLVPISVRISTNLMSRDKQRHTFVFGWLLRVPYILFKTQYRKDIWLFHTSRIISKNSTEFDWVCSIWTRKSLACSHDPWALLCAVFKLWFQYLLLWPFLTVKKYIMFSLVIWYKGNEKFL